MRIVMGLLLKAKAKLYALGAFLLAALAVAARIFFLQKSRDKYKKKSEEYQAAAHYAKKVADRDNELEGQEQSHRAEVKREIEDTGNSRVFRDPNKLFDDDPD